MSFDCAVLSLPQFIPQSTHNPPTVHPQANPTLRPKPRPPPCLVLSPWLFSSRDSSPLKAKAKTPNTHAPPARSGLLYPPHPFGLFGGVGGVNSKTHNPRTSKPDLAPEAVPSSLLGAFALAFFLPLFQPAKSQGENSNRPRTARKVGFAFSPAPIRHVRGCWGCEYKRWCNQHPTIP